MKNLTLIVATLVSLSTFGQPLFPPSNLTTEINEQNVELNWEKPDTTIYETLSYSGEVHANALGIAGGGSFAIAARWEPNQLVAYNGLSINKITLFVADEFTQLTLKIWEGPYSDSLAYSQEISDIEINSFLDIVLDNPFIINANKELWIGYEISHPNGAFPVSMDQGPGVHGFGDLLFFEEEWRSLGDFGFDGNWNIIAHLTIENQQLASSKVLTKETLNFSNNEKPHIIEYEPVHYNNLKNNNSELLGYNVYRDNELLNSSPLTELTFTDTQVANGLYSYGVTALYDSGESLPLNETVYIGDLSLTVSPSEIVDSFHFNDFGQYKIQITNPTEITIDWKIPHTQDWLFVHQPEGTLDAGETIEIIVQAFTYSQQTGTFSGEIVFLEYFNDIPLAEIPISITLTDGPFISVWPNEVNLGNIYYGRESYQYLYFNNSGNDTVIITGIAISSDNIQLENMDFPIILPPFDYRYNYVTVEGSQLGAFNETITIFSNDANNPEKEIPISATVVLEPPLYILNTIDSSGINLKWDMAINFNDPNWFGWSKPENFTGYGLGETGVFYAASRWYPEDLTEQNDKTLTQVAFFPYGNNSTYTIHVWQGDENTDPWVSQVVDFYQPFTWNSIDLDIPIELVNNQELWVAIEVNNADWEYPMGVDRGPEVDQKGNLINIGDGWQTIEGGDVNWNIMAFATDTEAGIVKPIAKNNTTLTSDLKGKMPRPSPLKISAKNNSKTIDIIGYNVYRDGEKLNTETITEKVYSDAFFEDGIFEYGVSTVYDLGESEAITTLVQTALPGIVFTPETIVGNVNSGDIETFNFTITNDGEIDLEYVSDFSYFLQINPSAGTISPGQTATLELSVDLTYSYPGLWTTQVLFQINDINNPYVYLPVEIMISGDGTVETSVDSVDFGMTLPGNSVLRYVELSNPGNGYAVIESIETSSDAFFAYSYDYYLYPYETYYLPVYFIPFEAGDYEEKLTINTFDDVITIDLYGQAVLTPPMNLTASADSSGVQLDWISPTGIPDNLLQYSANEPATAIGYSEGGSFKAAARFTQQELMNYSGRTLTHIGFYPFDAGAEYTIQAWTGNNGEELLFEQAVASYIPMEWNDISLNEPIALMDFETIYIGFEINHPAYSFPAAVDEGPAVSGKGDLIKIEGLDWESMAEMYGLAYNFMIRGITDQDSTNAADKNTNNVLLGYNVYRDGSKINVELVNATDYLDNDLQSGSYSYEVTSVYDNGESPAAGPVLVDYESSQFLPPGWNYTATGMTHTIFIPGNEAKMSGAEALEVGDYIGLFFLHDEQEICAGVIQWENSETLKLIAFGDNPNTTEKEGFSDNELMHWRVYKHKTGKIMHAEVSYNHDMPQYDGNFHMLGISMLNEISMNATIVDDLSLNTFSVYPTITSDFVTINGINPKATISVISELGQLVKNIESSQESLKLNVSDLKGTYFIQIKTDSKIEQHKVIIE